MAAYLLEILLFQRECYSVQGNEREIFLFIFEILTKSPTEINSLLLSLGTDKFIDYLLHRLQDELPAKLRYHSLEHPLVGLHSAEYLAKKN
jgi:hypothetical protein